MQWQKEKEDLIPIIDKVFSKGQFVGGEEIEEFETKIKKLCAVDYAISLNSGTDALTLALLLAGVGRGDEVITPPNSFIASTAVIVHLGAKPVFVDVLEDQNINPENIEAAISEKTKAIMPVHLNGKMCDMDKIMELAKKHSITVIEDAAQAIGSKFKEQCSGSIGKMGCFSAHPLKNLNAFGDAGFLTTNDKELAKKAKLLANHGLKDRNTVEEFGFVSRMDTLQAAILNYHLDNLKGVIEKRRENALVYMENLDSSLVSFDVLDQDFYNTYLAFVIQTDRREGLIKFLESKGIGTAIHYPTPIHLQPAALSLGYGKGSFPVVENQADRILSLPINQFNKKEEIKEVAESVNTFFVKKYE